MKGVYLLIYSLYPCFTRTCPKWVLCVQTQKASCDFIFFFIINIVRHIQCWWLLLLLLWLWYIKFCQDVKVNQCHAERQIFGSCTSGQMMGSDLHSSTSYAKITNALCRKKKLSFERRRRRSGVTSGPPMTLCSTEPEPAHIVRDFGNFTEWKKCDFNIVCVMASTSWMTNNFSLQMDFDLGSS